MMTEQVFDRIVKLAVAASTPFASFPFDCDEFLVRRDPNGPYEARPRPSYRRWVAKDVKGFVEMVRRGLEGRKSPAEAIGFIARNEVLVYIDPTMSGWEWVRFPLTYSPWFSRVVGQCQPQKPDAYIHELRAVYGLAADDRLIDLLRHVKFATHTDGEAEVRTGREQISRKVLASIAGADGADFPDTITFTGDVFQEFCFPVEVTCLLRMDPQEGVFWHVPLAKQLREAESDTLAYLGQAIEELAPGLRLMAGRPSLLVG